MADSKSTVTSVSFFDCNDCIMAHSFYVNPEGGTPQRCRFLPAGKWSGECFSEADGGSTRDQPAHPYVPLQIEGTTAPGDHAGTPSATAIVFSPRQQGGAKKDPATKTLLGVGYWKEKPAVFAAAL